METKTIKVISAISSIINQPVDCIDESFASWVDLEDSIIYDFEFDVVILGDDYLLNSSQFINLCRLSNDLDFDIILESDLHDHIMDEKDDHNYSDQSYQA